MLVGRSAVKGTYTAADPTPVSAHQISAGVLQGAYAAGVASSYYDPLDGKDT
jgi:hypothetical protein